MNDSDLIVSLSGADALDHSPKKNWVEENGGLPPYIHKIAVALTKSGKSTSAAISIAISRTKKWAAGGEDVDADTKAKAIKAVAEWEALKAKAKAKGKKIVKASREDGTSYMMLSATSFNTDTVRRAWDDLNQAVRRAQRLVDRAAGRDEYAVESPYSYIRELWTDYIIIEREGVPPQGSGLAKVPYGVTEDGSIYFGEPVTVEQQYVEVDDRFNAYEIAQLSDVMLSAPSVKEELETRVTEDSEIKRLVALSKR